MQTRPDTTPDRATLGIGLFSALAAVILAASGAHGPLAPVETTAIRYLDTAVTFHLFHSLALMMLAFWPGGRGARLAVLAGMVGGTLLFSGSLYLETMSPWALPGLITPLGGLLLIAGWSTWLVAVLAGAKPRS
ncbi:MAG: DUF423 domain-containing protein [Guyparkeria sp.]|uniref:DUF423 domain-containing protein n=1 Tax=Guyparkeria sp. TaxID=2035736 RepID=UPI00397A0859